MYGSIKLPKTATVTTDADGFDTVSEEYLENIPAKIGDVTRSDAVMADQLGYDAEMNVSIMAANYSGQSYLIDESDADGTKWYINRTYKAEKKNEIILTCGRRQRGGSL